jgi:hypothetical protein
MPSPRRQFLKRCPVLRKEESVEGRLRLMRKGEPPIEVAGRVLARLDHVVRPRTRLRPSRAVILVLEPGCGSVVLVANSGVVRRTLRVGLARS